ncbi:DNA polymerase III subunit chi [Piscinibacter sp.]|uniref:DNA polymerase III subunit chi n=1 Tax=Piscinibacter sp. TaxID=1903157 RepID=UPI0039E230E4
MTRVSFHFNVPQRLVYACRLLRKATRQNARIAVTGEARQLAELDRALWSFEPTEFIPHVLLRDGQALPERLRDTPVCLMPTPVGAPHHDVLLNLGAQPPAGFESFERLIEIVSTDEADRAAARARWKHYAARGYAIDKHEVEA